MITKESIDRIFETVRIGEVVGDFVQLKKRGVNLIGLCPFHDERTPSFNVNPTRNIYKCFGCGKGGNAVNFVMEHEHYSYPEALKYLAKKYNIDIEETAPDPAEEAARDEKESLFILNDYARKTFSDQLTTSGEGIAIGLSYFHERGFSDETIRKFQLGYATGEGSTFTNEAIRQGYREEYLEKTGLSVKNESGVLYDRFRGRVMFPIHNLSGRIIGFGGRVLKKNEKTAKYVNSPESEIYHKSKSLYGIYFSRKAIVQRDNCFLVEGYTDVISLHQAGIENVVASSGTSLTVEQIRLISRYTKNITILYDGDEAGIKASLRGTGLILEEGMNVRVVLFPDGDDPDSFSRKHSNSEVAEFIHSHAKDFILFKTGLLLGEVQNDPVRKAGLVREIVETIALIPDPIIRTTYIKQCSTMMEIEEQVLIGEMNKFRRKLAKKESPGQDVEELLPEILRPHRQLQEEFSTESQESNIIRLLLNFPNHLLQFDEENPESETSSHKQIQTYQVPVRRYIIDEIVQDDISFENQGYNSILRLFSEMVNQDADIDINSFLNSPEPEVSRISVELLSNPYFLSENWMDMHHIEVHEEQDYLKKSVEKSIYYLKKKKVLRMLEKNQKEIREAQEKGDDFNELLEKHKQLEAVKMAISKILGIDILR